jgi:hypothetical protein
MYLKHFLYPHNIIWHTISKYLHLHMLIYPTKTPITIYNQNAELHLLYLYFLFNSLKIKMFLFIKKMA